MTNSISLLHRGFELTELCFTDIRMSFSVRSNLNYTLNGYLKSKVIENVMLQRRCPCLLNNRAVKSVGDHKLKT